MWFTTLDGLVRYDGVRFTVFDKSNSKGLASNRIRCLYEDKSGTLWIGTEGGLAYYRDGVFKTVTTADGLPDDLIFDIQGDRDGGVLIVRARAMARGVTINTSDTPDPVCGRGTPYITGLRAVAGRSQTTDWKSTGWTDNRFPTHLTAR